MACIMLRSIVFFIAVYLTNAQYTNISIETALDTISSYLNRIEDGIETLKDAPRDTKIKMYKPLGTIGTKTYYKSIGIMLSWIDALQFCRSHGFQLASIESEIEQKALELFMAKEPQHNYWLSGLRIGELGLYWMSSGMKIDYSNWEGNQPDNYGMNENCVHIWDFQLFKWNDIVCTSKFEILCDKHIY